MNIRTQALPRSTGRHTRMVALCLAAVLVATPAAAEPLFSAAETGPAAAAGPGVLGSRLVRIEPEVVARTLAPPADVAAARATAAGTLPPEVELPLFPGVTVALDRDSVEEGSAGNVVWTGTGASRALGILVVTGSQVLGQVYDGAGGSFRIEPVDGALHRVVEVDTVDNRPDIILRPPGVRQQRLRAPVEPQAGDTSITVLVAFTAKAQQQSKNINADIDLAISLANKSYGEGAKIRLRLVDTMKVAGYNETSRSYAQVLYDLTGDSKAFDGVRARRDREKADLVALLRNNDNQYCGIAWLLENPTAALAAYGFSVTSIGCIPNYTFTHEIGHNIGLQHDRYVSDPASSKLYNFGYVNTTARFRTIMAYNNRCYDRGFDCARIPYFSDDTKKYKNEERGIAAGKAGAADANKALRENRTAISRFR